MSKKNKVKYKDKGLVMGNQSDNLTALLLNYFTILATSRFVYENIPFGNNVVDWLERQLFMYGSVVWFEDNDGVSKALPYATQGGLNVYGIPTKWKVIGANGYNKNLNETNSVLVKANTMMLPHYNYVKIMVDKLVNIEGALDVNIENSKVLSVFSGSEDSLLTFKNLWNKITSNDPVVYIEKGLDMNVKFTGVGTGFTFLGPEFMQLYNDYEGRILKVLGLKYVHTEKKERLITDEVNSVDGMTNMYLSNDFVARQNAVTRYNELNKTNIVVKINPLLLNVGEADADADEVGEKEGE